MYAFRVAKNAGLNFLNIVVSLVAGVGVSIVVTRYLGPERYGEYQTAVWLVATGTMILGFGMSETARRYVAAMDGQGQQTAALRLASTILKIQLGVTIVAVALLVLGAQLVADALRQPTLARYVVLASIALGPELLSSILQSVLAGFQRFGSLTIVGILRSLVTLTVALMAAHLDMGIEGLLSALIALNLGIMSVLVFTVYRLRREHASSLHTQPSLDIRPLVTYSAMVFLTIMMDMVVRSQVFFLNRLSSSAEVGFYSLSSSLSYLAVATIPNALSGVLMPALAERWGASDQRWLGFLYMGSLRSIALMSLPISVGGILIARPAILSVYGESYARAASALPFMLVACTSIILTSPAAALLHAINRVDVLAKIGIGLALLNVIVSWLFVPRLGAVGAAMAFMVVRTLGAFATFVVVERLLHLRHKLRPFTLNLLAALVCAIPAYALARVDARPLFLLVGVLASAVVYVALVFTLGIISKSERALIWASMSDRWRARLHSTKLTSR